MSRKGNNRTDVSHAGPHGVAYEGDRHSQSLDHCIIFRLT